MKKLILIMSAVGSLALAETQFVQSQKISVKSEASSSGKEVGSLVRGDEVEVLQTQGSWSEIKKGDVKGWVSKLFINKNKPVGAAALNAEAPLSDAKNSRRREGSYAVSASTRGLLPNERSRSGREKYKVDTGSLEKVEAQNPTNKEVDQFVKEGEGSKK